jgi:hypothetical protein
MGHEITNCGSDKVTVGTSTLIELSVGIEDPPQGAMLHIAMAGSECLTMAQWNTLRSSAADTQVTTASWADDLEDKSPDWYARVMGALSSRGLLATSVKQALRNHAKRYQGFTYPDPL